MRKIKRLVTALACLVLAAWLPLAAGAEQRAGRGANLLRNASFLQSTNRPIPDYWDLHHAAGTVFKELHRQYFISATVPSPVAGTRTLVLQNSEAGFYHAILAPHNLPRRLPEGTYTFSVYARSKGAQADLVIYRSWGGQLLARKPLSRTWQRYAVSFQVKDADGNPPQPMLYFPGQATYFVAAPQLEQGSTASAFSPASEDAVPERDARTAAAQGDDRNAVNRKIARARREVAPLRAFFDKDYYTVEDAAYLDVATRYDAAPEVRLDCPGERAGAPAFSGRAVADRSGSARIRVPLASFSLGKHLCTVTARQGTRSAGTTPVVLTRLAERPHRVRVTSRRCLEVDGVPFFLIGMEVGGATLPDWYLDDLASHGINTLFMSAAQSAGGAYDLVLIEQQLKKARRHGLKVVLGRPLMGCQDPRWRQKLRAFKELVVKLRDDPAVIAWEVVDEPAAPTWKDAELLQIYRELRDIDPYRAIFMNWAYDGVPAEIGREPLGTLNATDFYSKDYYPFAAQDDSTFKYAGHAVRALETARMFNKIPHAWIQLYGGMDAWREPTGDELSYMVYLNLLYGGMYSYWNTKSNCAATWSRVAEINRQAQTLAGELFLNPEAQESGLPQARGNFTLSVWKRGRAWYVIVLHNGKGSETLDYDLAGLVGRQAVSVHSLFEGRDLTPEVRGIKEQFAPYQSRVYLVLPGKGGSPADASSPSRSRWTRQAGKAPAEP